MNASDKIRHRLLFFIHVFVIVLSVGLVGIITYDCLNNVSFLTSAGFFHVQFWICCLLFLSIVAEMAIRRDMTVTDWLTHIAFLIICIPYISIFAKFDIHPSPQATYIFRFIPMLRAVYALSIVTGAMTKSWIKGLFFSYLMILVLSLYFGSLMFYIEEHFVNPAVTDFWTAIYWACMDVTTCGCAINAITPTGKVLAVVLAAEGLMLFPVFTVYVTDLATHTKAS